MRLDSAGLEILDRQNCLRLLAAAPVGRVIYTEQALPAVQPVLYALVGDAVVFRTAEGSRLAVGTRGAVVGFEADVFDPDAMLGWSVTIVGHASVVEDDADRAILAALPLHRWTAGEPDHYVRIQAERTSGRRVPRVPSASDALR
jgi:nitroimidazol reductase NimA-like FMN-containing flavoprotein (pyridoxamine 5'-phosphate oxidase superfamily)